MDQNYFKYKAENYEQVNYRVTNIENIAHSILSYIKVDKTMHIMDFGSGTGLLLEKVAPFVKRITAVDISKSMNAQLIKKKNSLGCEFEIEEYRSSQIIYAKKIDGIISSMTMHHIKNTHSIFKKFYSMLNKDGFIAIADLDVEDGSFHTENTGVHHFGFDRNTLLKLTIDAGFKNVKTTSANTMCTTR